MKRSRPLRIAIRAAASLAYVLASITLSFYFTDFLYRRFNWHPPALVVQVVNTLLGVAFMVLAVAIPTVLFHTRQRNPFTPIIDALQRIARGDFSIRLDDSPRSRGVFSELVQSVNHMALKLDEMEKMRQEFISDVSHEIQSPLTSIRGFASALQQDNISAEDRRHYVEVIEAESLRLSKLSANLLKLASLESEQVRFDPRRYRLDMQIRSVILACEPQWTARGLDVEVDLDEVAVTADEDLLSQVWINLIHNSIKFTPEGGSIRIGLHRRGDRVEMEVSDTGIGIAPEDQPRVFERFYKSDKSRTGTRGGNGLGLSIARKVVELHHGTIAVRSKPGEGATFIVELPVQ